jgi:hypothetical protein
LRQPNRCCGEIPCRRATSDTTGPGAYDAATIRPLTSSLHRRRCPAPTWISTRPRGFEASTIWSTIYANRTVCNGLTCCQSARTPQGGGRAPLSTDNAYAESFNATVRLECLGRHWFLDLETPEKRLKNGKPSTTSTTK